VLHIPAIPAQVHAFVICPQPTAIEYFQALASEYELRAVVIKVVLLDLRFAQEAGG
jgi:hypothetical protein